MAHPYRYLIERYFPSVAWDDAECITTNECSPDREGYPQTCIGHEGLIDCGPGPVQARSWGIWQVLDACWSPYMNPNSPFTAEQWGMVLDPNVNTWMASVIFRRNGWSAWTTCGACGVCDVEPPAGWEPLPAPIGDEVPPPAPGGGIMAILGLALIAIGGSALLTSRGPTTKVVMIQQRRL